MKTATKLSAPFVPALLWAGYAHHAEMSRDPMGAVLSLLAVPLIALLTGALMVTFWAEA